jgi:hypothetical protein
VTPAASATPPSSSNLTLLPSTDRQDVAQERPEGRKRKKNIKLIADRSDSLGRKQRRKKNMKYRYR